MVVRMSKCHEEDQWGKSNVKWNVAVHKRLNIFFNTIEVQYWQECHVYKEKDFCVARYK